MSWQANGSSRCSVQSIDTRPFVADSMRPGFKKRRYRSIREFLTDLWIMSRNLPRILGIFKGQTVSPAFRERLMLAVTSVYGCRFCNWAHTREAFRSGISGDEITCLLSGIVDGCPPEEATAILYAQHWADSDTRPTPESFKTLVDSYGKEKAQAVNLVLRMIRVGNLTGNTWDYLLYRLSFGRLGT